MHRDDAISCPKRLNVIGIDTDNDCDQPGAVRKDLCEVQHTPTPVRVPMVLQGPTWRPQDEGTAGPSTAEGRLVRLSSYPEHRGAQSGAAVEAVSGRARGSL